MIIDGYIVVVCACSCIVGFQNSKKRGKISIPSLLHCF